MAIYITFVLVHLALLGAMVYLLIYLLKANEEKIRLILTMKKEGQEINMQVFDDLKDSDVKGDDVEDADDYIDPGDMTDDDLKNVKDNK